MKFGEFLHGAEQVAVQVAPAVVSVYSPVLGSLLSGIVNAQAQVTGPKKGPERKAMVMGSTPIVALWFVEAMLGRKISDPKQFNDALGLLNDGLVALTNSMDGFPDGK